MNEKKIVLGMSGGVDSSVAALLLTKQGYKVHGFFMNCNVSGSSKLPSTIDWREEEESLRKICEKLRIVSHVHDCELGYEKRVIGKMIEDYKRNLTPNPDILCNKIGKFPKMFKLAKEIGAEKIATGHYARVRKGKAGYELLRGKDREKDQSYFLCELNQKILSKTIFPLGEMTKKEVREIARRNGFQNWDKRSSRGICYLGRIDVKSFLKSKIKEREGDVIFNGQKVGTHPGSMFFTIGERVGDKMFKIDKKFRKKMQGRWFIARKTSGNKIVIVPSGDKILRTKRVFIKGFKLINPREKLRRENLRGRIRHLGELCAGKLMRMEKRWIFEFNSGQEGVAPGQSIALYDGERLVASGEIRLR